MFIAEVVPGPCRHRVRVEDPSLVQMWHITAFRYVGIIMQANTFKTSAVVCKVVPLSSGN